MRIGLVYAMTCFMATLVLGILLKMPVDQLTRVFEKQGWQEIKGDDDK